MGRGTSTPPEMKLRFVQAAQAGEVSFRQLCRQVGISVRTGYTWMDRFAREGAAGLEDRSRQPLRSPRQTPQHLRDLVLYSRDTRGLGPKKIRAILQTHGWEHVPSVKTIGKILHQEGRIDPAESRSHRPFIRFEAERPNNLWQMDFKGHFPLPDGTTRCHPMTILDDHSRFLIGLFSCHTESYEVVKGHLTTVFTQYGLPKCIISDNGPPWGNTSKDPYTRLSAWLMRLGITVSHARARHPQTCGKDERLHRSLKEEVLTRESHATLEAWQRAFDDWRRFYNELRPHMALDMCVPVSKYAPSERPFPEELPPVTYGPEFQVRKVDKTGWISFQGREVYISRSFYGQPVGLLPTDHPMVYDVYFCKQQVGGFHLDEWQKSKSG